MSFTVRNTNNEELLNELSYSLSNSSSSSVKVLSRTESSPDLLLDDFNTVHYYSYSGSAKQFYDMNSTLLVDSAIYEMNFHCWGSTESNNDMLLVPLMNVDSGSRFYTTYQGSENNERNTVVFANEVNSDGFYFDFFPGSFGYDPMGSVTVYNDRSSKKVMLKASDTASTVTGAGYWLDNSTASRNYSYESVTSPVYNSESVWLGLGVLSFGEAEFTNWRIRITRVG